MAPAGLLPNVAQSPPVAANGELVNGAVYDTGQRAVSGETAEVTGGSQTATPTITNEKGEFSLRGSLTTQPGSGPAKIDECVQQEIAEPEGRRGGVRRVVQRLTRSPDAPRDARDGSWPDTPRVVNH